MSEAKRKPKPKPWRRQPLKKAALPESADALREVRAAAAFDLVGELLGYPGRSSPELEEVLDRWAAAGTYRGQSLTLRLAVLAWETTRCTAKKSERFGTGRARLRYIVQIAGVLREDDWLARSGVDAIVDQLNPDAARKPGPMKTAYTLACMAYGVLSEGARVQVTDSNPSRLRGLMTEAARVRSVPD
jgi:hypothetical protein